MLPPILRMKLIMPETLLPFSGGIPMYPAAVMGTNRNPIPTTWTVRSHIANLKLTNKSI